MSWKYNHQTKCQHPDWPILAYQMGWCWADWSLPRTGATSHDPPLAKLADKKLSCSHDSQSNTRMHHHYNPPAILVLSPLTCNCNIVFTRFIIAHAVMSWQLHWRRCVFAGRSKEWNLWYIWTPNLYQYDGDIPIHGRFRSENKSFNRWNMPKQWR